MAWGVARSLSEMEPMTLGSPINSPGGGGNSQYPYYSHQGMGLLSPSSGGAGQNNQHASMGHQPTTPSHHQPGTGFLPGFLMGDYTQQVRILICNYRLHLSNSNQCKKCLVLLEKFMGMDPSFLHPLNGHCENLANGYFAGCRADGLPYKIEP